MKIDFGHGTYLEPGPEPCDSRYQKRIVGAAPIQLSVVRDWSARLELPVLLVRPQLDEG